MNIDASTQIAFAIHNAGVRSARREYAAHPATTECIDPKCDQIALIEAGFCYECAQRANLCPACQIRPTDDGKHVKCTRCRRPPRSATERMRLRRAKLKETAE